MYESAVWHGRGVPVQVAGHGWIFLLAWGRAPDGWYACVKWEDYLYVPERRSGMHVDQTAWRPAEQIRPIVDQVYGDVPRIMLPADPDQWPVPPHASAEWAYHHGLLTGPAPKPPWAERMGR